MQYPEHEANFSFGKLTLRTNVCYTVIQAFKDDNEIQHLLHEKWFYMGYSQPKLYAGVIVYVRQMNKPVKQLSIKWDSESYQNFEVSVKAPDLDAMMLIENLSLNSKMLLEEYQTQLNDQNLSAEALLEKVREFLGNMSCADGRSASGNPYEKIVKDLEMLYSNMETTIHKLLIEKSSQLKS